MARGYGAWRVAGTGNTRSLAISRPVLDDEVGPAFDAIYDCGFDEDGSAAWWARRGNAVVRVLQDA